VCGKEANFKQNSTEIWVGSQEVCKNNKRNGFLPRNSCELEKEDRRG